MSETNQSVSLSAVSRTLTLTTDYVQIFTQTISVGRISVSMVEGGVDIGAIEFLVGGGIAKSDAFTGGQYFSDSLENSLLPVHYGASSNSKNYTLSFAYEDNTLKVAKAAEDPELTITFTALFSSAAETVSNGILAIDRIVESESGNGITFDNKVVLAGGVEHSNLPSDTITFNDTANISYTNVSSKATRVGKVCNIVIKATMSVSGLLLTKGTLHDFFSITPTEDYTVAYVHTGMLFDGTTNEIGAIFNTANTADFRMVLPRTLSIGASTTVYGSITYIA